MDAIADNLKVRACACARMQRRSICFGQPLKLSDEATGGWRVPCRSDGAGWRDRGCGGRWRCHAVCRAS